MWERDKLEHQVPRFADPSVGLVYGRLVRFGHQLKVGVPWPAALPEGDVFERLYFWCFVPCFKSVVFRQAAIPRIGWLRYAAVDHCRFRCLASAGGVVEICGGWASRLPIPPARRSDDHPAGAGPVRHMLQVPRKHASELERRTGVSPVAHSHRLAQIYLKELTWMLNRRRLTEARALVAVLDEEFECDTANIRQAIARKRRIAALPKSAFWLRDLVRQSTGFL